MIIHYKWSRYLYGHHVIEYRKKMKTTRNNFDASKAKHCLFEWHYKTVCCISIYNTLYSKQVNFPLESVSIDHRKVM